MPYEPTRRQMLNTSIAAGSAALLAPATALGASDGPPDEPFGYCLNTSTIRGQKLPLVAELEIAARAGFKGVEPWVAEIDQYTRDGGTLPDLRKRIADLGLSVESVIGFAQWIVDDDAKRAAGMEEAKRVMDMTAQIGGTRLAAPPAGLSDQDDPDLETTARRYRALLELGREQGVVPQLEVWGFSRKLSKLSEAAYVAVAAGHPDSCILADSYHLYKGGSNYESLAIIAGSAMHVFHINDYPADPPREEITDAHRVFPGDGVAPLDTLFRTLRDSGFRGMLSLEVFNREYWNQDALYVARDGYEKTREAVQKALG
ncbi:MAG: sugar phosphate isomerase/epimerase [Planctomycetota bacterium]|nr:MAG: sugar phosphate isomerase/epimerase [Planctomycetota bacterium]